MNFNEELKKFREKERFRKSIVGFIDLTRTMERKEKTSDACPYLAICPNTEEVFAYGANNTTINMDPTIDCVGGFISYSQCPLYKCMDRESSDILQIIEGDRSLRAAFYLPSKEI